MSDGPGRPTAAATRLARKLAEYGDGTVQEYEDLVTHLAWVLENDADARAAAAAVLRRAAEIAAEAAAARRSR